MSTYTRSNQLYYFKNKRKILEKTREARRKRARESYQRNKEAILARNKDYRERKRQHQLSEGIQRDLPF